MYNRRYRQSIETLQYKFVCDVMKQANGIDKSVKLNMAPLFKEITVERGYKVTS